jgi:hypothetical protein
MGRTACTEPQCLYKGALYLLYFLWDTGITAARIAQIIQGLTTGRGEIFFSPLQNLQTTTGAHSGSYSMHARGKVTLREPAHAPPAGTKVRNGGVTPLLRLHAIRHARGAGNIFGECTALKNTCLSMQHIHSGECLVIQNLQLQWKKTSWWSNNSSLVFKHLQEHQHSKHDSPGQKRNWNVSGMG